MLARFPSLLSLSLAAIAVPTAWAQDAEYGYSTRSAGDVNGDGFGDVIVGAPFQVGENGKAGRAYVYLGGPTGLSTTPDWTADGETGRDRFGSAVVGLGDVNGDGYDDIAVSAPHFDTAGSRQVYVGTLGHHSLDQHGRVYVYPGGPNGPWTTPAWTHDGIQPREHFGRSLSGGDVNGDGFDDVVIGAPGTYGTGAIFVFHGSLGGPGVSPNRVVYNDRPNTGFGWNVAADGDANGDGYDDVLLGARNGGSQKYGAAKFYAGGPTGIELEASWVQDGFTLFAIDAGNFGASVAWSDLDGDGKSEAIVADPGADHIRFGLPSFPSVGKLFVYTGTLDGPAEAAGFQQEGYPAPWERHGAGLSGGVDVDGDGREDLLVGSPGASGSLGRLVLYRGSGGAGGPGLDLLPSLFGSQPGADFGSDVALSADVDGDGLGDLLVAEPHYVEPGVEGRVRLYRYGGSGIGAWTWTGSN